MALIHHQLIKGPSPQRAKEHSAATARGGTSDRNWSQTTGQTAHVSVLPAAGETEVSRLQCQHLE